MVPSPPPRARLCRQHGHLRVGTRARAAGHSAPLEYAGLRREGTRVALQRDVTILCARDGLGTESARKSETKSKALSPQKSRRGQTGAGAKHYPQMRFVVLPRPMYLALVV